MATRVNLRVGKFERLEVGIEDEIVKQWIRGRMGAAIDLFRRKMTKPSPSAPFDYPANVSGAMSAGITGPFLYGFVGRVDMSALNKAGKDYTPFHKRGTKKMAPRKLVNDALFEVLRKDPEKAELASAATFGYRGNKKLSIR